MQLYYAAKGGELTNVDEWRQNNEEIKRPAYLPVEWLFERKIQASSRHEPCTIRKTWIVDSQQKVLSALLWSPQWSITI